MKTRAFILGILSFIVLILIWNFYGNVIAYDPLKEAEMLQVETAEKEKTAPVTTFGAWGKEIEAKNLFSQQRGVLPPPPPPVIIAPKIEPPKPPRPALVLKGIILNEFGEYVALIEKSGTKPIALRKGDTIDGALVSQIDERNVQLIWEDEVIRLSMEKIRTIHK